MTTNKGSTMRAVVYWAGTPVYVNAHLTVEGPTVVRRRSIAERLLKGLVRGPWTPHVRFKHVRTRVPDPAMYSTPDGSLHAHPATLEAAIASGFPRDVRPLWGASR